MNQKNQVKQSLKERKEQKNERLQLDSIKFRSKDRIKVVEYVGRSMRYVYFDIVRDENGEVKELIIVKEGPKRS